MHRKKKIEDIADTTNRGFVPVSRIKESTANFDHPLDLETILELSGKGILKEKEVKPKKVA